MQHLLRKATHIPLTQASFISQLVSLAFKINLKAHSSETNYGEAKQHLKQEDDDITFANNIVSSFVFPLAVRSAVELGIFDVLAKVGKDVKLSAEDIAVEIRSKNPEAATMLDRLLRLLATHSMLHCSLSEDQQGLASPRRLYGLAPVSKYFLTDADGASYAPILNLFLDKIALESWSGVKGAIMEGDTPFQRVYGMHIYEYAGCDPRFNDIFHKAMVNVTTIVMKRVLEFYKGFEHVNKLVDVGGGHGINLKRITSKYPHMHGVNLDLPHVIKHAPTYPGVTLVRGDMFESVPNGDAIFMKWILHNWNDEHCLKLLKNCHKAIPNDGKVIVVDSILPVLPESTIIAKYDSQMDLVMMALQPGGKERTQNEFVELALGSGFSGIKFVCCISGSWVMEFFK